MDERYESRESQRRSQMKDSMTPLPAAPRPTSADRLAERLQLRKEQLAQERQISAAPPNVVASKRAAPETPTLTATAAFTALPY